MYEAKYMLDMLRQGAVNKGTKHMWGMFSWSKHAEVNYLWSKHNACMWRACIWNKNTYIRHEVDKGCNVDLFDFYFWTTSENV